MCRTGRERDRDPGSDGVTAHSRFGAGPSSNPHFAAIVGECVLGRVKGALASFAAIVGLRRLAGSTREKPRPRTIPANCSGVQYDKLPWVTPPPPIAPPPKVDYEVIHYATKFPVLRTPCGILGPAASDPAFVTCPSCKEWLAKRRTRAAQRDRAVSPGVRSPATAHENVGPWRRGLAKRSQSPEAR